MPARTLTACMCGQSGARSARQIWLDAICDALEVLHADGLLTTAYVHILACGVAQQLALEVRGAGTCLSRCVRRTCISPVNVQILPCANPTVLAGVMDSPSWEPSNARSVAIVPHHKSIVA